MKTLKKAVANSNQTDYRWERVKLMKKLKKAVGKLKSDRLQIGKGEMNQKNEKSSWQTQIRQTIDGKG